jgi:hypothetical protein
VTGLLSEVLLREVPERLVAGVGSGELKVYGSIIRSMVNGRVVGHLQETSGLANLAGNMLMAPASLPLQGGGLVLDAVGHSVSYVQNEQIKAAIELLQSMQLASLALGAASIGVSVAGFAVLSRKLGRVEAKVEQLEPKLQEIQGTVRAIRSDQLAEDFVRLRTALEQLDEGWILPDPVAQWRHVAAETHYLANQFQRRAIELLESGPAAVSLAEPLTEALALAAGARVSARMAAGDDAAALAAATDGAKSLSEVGQRVRLAEAAMAMVPAEVSPGTIEWGSQLDSIAEKLKPVAQGYRSREQAAAATCMTLSKLEGRQIGCREWLEAARDENEAPLLCLAIAEAE